MRNPIIRYVRTWNGKPVGCVVAIEEDNDMGFAVGWSQCNPKDQFIKKVARDTAIFRAKHGCSVEQGNPSLVKEIDGKWDLMNFAIYDMHLLAEERFLGRDHGPTRWNPFT